MVNVINGQQILDTNLDKITKIFNDRSYHDYYNDLGTYFCSGLVNEIKLNGKNYIIYLSEDWYFVFKQKIITIELVEMVANINISPKNMAEMLKVLKEFFLKYRNYIFVSNLRQDTTYKLLNYLKKNNNAVVYLDSIYSIHPNQDIRDKMMKKVKKSIKLEDDEYKYIMHYVIFRLNKKFKEKKLC